MAGNDRVFIPEWGPEPKCPLSPSDLKKLDELQVSHPALWRHIRECGQALLFLAYRNIESGWLIERVGPEWLYIPNWFAVEWTKDSIEAIRFSRKSDAHQIAKMLTDYKDIEITEHTWG